LQFLLSVDNAFGRLPLEVFRAHLTGRRPRGIPSTRWRDYISQIAWECHRFPQEEQKTVAEKRNI